MELRNFWWLLIWLFTGGYLLNNYVPKETIIISGKKEKRWTLRAAIALVLPYIIWAGFRWDYIDTGSYRQFFLEAPRQISEWGQYIESLTKDEGFYIITLLMKYVLGNSDVLYFLIIAAVQILCIVFVCRQYSSDYWLSIFLFVASTDYMSWTWNGMRQFLAVTIVFATTPLILKKDYIKVILIILFASTIHGTALLMIPIVFIMQGKSWNSKTVLCIIFSILALTYVDQFTNILDTMLVDTQYTNVVSDWQSWNDDGMNPIRVLVYSIPTILSLVGIKYIRNADEPIINLATNAGIIATGLAIIAMGTSGIHMGRLPIYVSL